MLPPGGGRTAVGLLLAGVAAVAIATTVSIGTAPRAPASPPSLKTDASWRTGTAAADRAAVAATVDRLTGGGAATVAEPRWADMLRYSVLDLNQLSSPSGGVAAGAADHWSYVWPRDSAFAVAAWLTTGERDRARSTLSFLSRVQLPDGGFQARYLPDGSGVPDDRPRQTDGAGWVLWALGRLATSAASESEAMRDLDPLTGLLDRATQFVLDQTSAGRELPDPSPDYWEVREQDVTLGTVGALLAGLRGSQQAYAVLGRDALAARSGAAADRLEQVVHDAFAASGFQRYAGGGGHDAAVCLLLPPFADDTRPEVVRAWRTYQTKAARPAGGVAPGAGWRQDGVSWTPETALVAYTAAASGDRPTATRLLDWLDAHRTAWRSLPEKVLADGRPAGPAPLGWTAAVVILTIAELHRG